MVMRIQPQESIPIIIKLMHCFFSPVEHQQLLGEQRYLAMGFVIE
ncbi:hypothetical protein [Planococcus koreensis]